MPQTFYIESDEEIISVIGRLRTSSAEENVFVFPKRALVLQSIVNLRLFQREAEKLGKKIIIVSQDEMGRMLAEKAGVATENYSEDFSRKETHLELTAHQDALAPVAPLAVETPPGMPRSDAIGSADFYASQGSAVSASVSSTSKVSPQLSRETDQTMLRVRNATPDKLTSLNSKRLEETPAPTPAPNRLDIPLQSAQVFSPAPTFRSAVSPAPSFQSKSAGDDERNNRLKNFYNGTRSMPEALSEEKPRDKNVSITGKKAHTIFFVLGGVSLLSLIGVMLFIFLPKAEVHVTPYTVIQPTDVEMTGRVADASGSDDAIIAVRVLEKDIETILTAATTGKSGGVNQKARGSVIIYNNFSTDPQPLIATTRLETADGKLFRLVNGVTVPGMTNADGKKEAGVIETTVIADQSGEAYNLDPTTFTIPGFKGNPKYAAFSAKSTKAMVGGGDAGTSDVTVVARVDLDTVEREAKEKAKETFLNEMRSGISPDEKIFDEQIDIMSLSLVSLPEIGTALNSFEYKNTFKVRAFVFSEKAVREKVENMIKKDMQGITLKPISSSITYSESVANFSEATLRLRAHALVTMESDIDRDALKKALLGQSEDAIQEVLNAFPAVKKISVIFHPEWFVRSVPSAEDRVMILVEPGEAVE